jgi:hypothetical protein
LVYFPLTSIYTHYFNSIGKIAYIGCGLENIVVGQQFNIYGEYSNSFTPSAVFLGNNKIYDITSETKFNIQQVINKEGVYTYYLKENINGNWNTIDSVTVPIGKKSIAGQDTFFGIVISPIIKIILAIIIIMILTLSPLIIATFLSVKGHFTQVSIPALVYIGFFFLGTSITCVIGFLDWSVLFIELLALIIAFAVLYISRKGESGE